MEKKRVRLYRAQQGGQPPIDMLGYPGAQQEQQQLSEEQVTQMIVNDIGQDVPKAAIVNKLVNAVGMDITAANQYVEQVYQTLQQQIDNSGENEENMSPEEQETVQTEDQLSAEEPEQKRPMKKIEGHNDLAMEDDEGEEEYLTDLEDENMMRFGGMPRMQDGGDIADMADPMLAANTDDWGNEANPVYFPGIEAYLPSQDFTYSNPAADIAWQEPQVDQSQFQEPNYQLPEEFKMGGFKTKRGYVNNVMRLVKKQMGGDQEQSSNDADPIGNDLRTNHLDAFLGSVKREGNLSIAKEQAEKQYEQAMQQFQMMQAQENALSQFIPQNYGMPEAQFGAQIPAGFRNERQFNRFMRQLPLGTGYGVPNVSRVDVRKSGLFGRLRQYSVEFDNSPLKVMAANPMIPGIYGYGFNTQVTRTPARVITETVRNTVNNEATKEVAAATKSDAAATSATNGATTNTSTEANPESGKATTEVKVETPTGTEVATKTIDTPVNTERFDTSIKNNIGVPEGVKLVFTKERPDAAYYKKDGKWYISPNYAQEVSGQEKIFEITDPERIKRIEGFKGDQSKYGQGLSGKDYEYHRDTYGDWYFSDKNGNSNKVTNKESLKRLNNNESKSSVYVTLESKPGYYYRVTNDGNYVKFKGDPAKHNSKTKPVQTITKKSNPEAWKVLTQQGEYGGKHLKFKEEGGPVNNPFQDQFGNLQRFVSGGNEDPSIANITQSDINDTQSKDVTEPYMPQAQYGGYGRRLMQTYFPANLAPQYYSKYLGTSGAAGVPMVPQFGPNTMVKSIDVHKSGMFGQPKRYSITFANPEMDPRKQNLITLDKPENATTFQGQTGKPQTLSAKELRNGERQAGRQRPWYAGKKYEEYFEDYERTPEEQALAAEKEAQYQANVARYHKERADAANMINQIFNPHSTPGMSAEQIEQFRQFGMNPAGIPAYREYGGDLGKFIPAAQYGAETPVVYTNNPAMQGVSDVDLITLNPGIPGLGSPAWAEPMPGAPQMPTIQDTGVQQPEQMTIDPNQPYSHQVKKTYTPPAGEFTMNFKTKSTRDPQAAILTTNAALEGVTGMIDRWRNKKNEKQMYKNLTADNLYAQQAHRDRGDYDTNSGLFRPDEQGQLWNSRSKQYGGQMSDYNEGDEVYMTDEELENFLKNGGQVEYL